MEVEPGFTSKEIRWAVVCDDAGGFLDVVELGDAGQKKNRGQTFSKCPNLSQPELIGGKETRSHFLVETAGVVALHGVEDADLKNREKHRYFVGLLREAGRVMPELGRVAGPLDDPETLVAVRSRLASLGAKATDKVTFRVGGGFPIESSAWHDWWRGFRRTLSADKVRPRGAGLSPPMRCFASGDLVEPAQTHLKVGGLAGVGGQPSGDALICFDKDSFGSYGLQQSTNSAVSERAMCAYVAALNDLIRHHSRLLAGARVVHWFKSQVPREDDPLSWLEEGEEEQERNAQHLAGELLDSIRTGKRPDLATNRFYALTLSGAAGRVMVRTSWKAHLKIC